MAKVSGCSIALFRGNVRLIEISRQKITALHASRAWGAVIFWREISISRKLLRKRAIEQPLTFGICHSSLIRHSSFVGCNPVSTSGRISWPMAFTLVAVLIVAVILIIFWRIETWPARTARQSTAQLEKLGNELRRAFIDLAHLQPRMTINNRVYMEQRRASPPSAGGRCHRGGSCGSRRAR